MCVVENIALFKNDLEILLFVLTIYMCIYVRIKCIVGSNEVTDYRTMKLFNEVERAVDRVGKASNSKYWSISIESHLSPQ